MTINSWLKKNVSSLAGKTVAITGPTGGLGKALCRYLVMLGADLVFIDRSKKKSDSLREELSTISSGSSITRVEADMEDPDSVRAAAEKLKGLSIDALICNAGAYSIPRHTAKNGYDNVFQINFVSHYVLIRELLPSLKERHGRVVVVSSIAMNYSVSDPSDVDFSTRSASSLVYGNSKRYLTYTLFDLFKDETDVRLAITHPGISFTNITAHYPKLIFAIIKHPMKIIFPSNKKACLSILLGLFEDTPTGTWIGPGIFNVWGLPRKMKIPKFDCNELQYFSSFNNSDFTERKL